MIARFYFAALIFHLGVGATALLIGRRWTREPAMHKSAARWGGALLRDAVWLGAAICLFALVAGLIAPRRPSVPFAVLRFLCQGLFGEGIALAAGVAVLHFRSGAPVRGVLLALLASALLLVYAEAYHRGPHDLQVRRHALDLSRGRPDARVLRILHLSDLQTHAIGPYEERALRAASEQKADLILFTGDYIQERLAPTRARATADLVALLRRAELQAPLGFFAVDGDVDRDWPRLFDGTAVTCLTNTHTRLSLPDGRSLALIGLSVGMSRGYDEASLLEVVDAAPPADLRIVIGHSPDFVRALAGRRPVDLALAGHTHGGQMVIPFWGPPLTLSRLPRRYAGGLNTYEGLPLHVSRGIGRERGTAPQIRFLCPPEICVLEVRY
jgi:predicted MPP superfamily phosphohydrolase